MCIAVHFIRDTEHQWIVSLFAHAHRLAILFLEIYGNPQPRAHFPLVNGYNGATIDRPPAAAANS